MISAAPLRAARRLLGIDPRQAHSTCRFRLPILKRMEASEGVIRGNVDSLMKLIGALDGAGVVPLGEGMPRSGGGRGVRLNLIARALREQRSKSDWPARGVFVFDVTLRETRPRITRDLP